MSSDTRRPPGPGRPPIYERATTGRIHVRVTDAQQLALQRVAVANGTGVASVIRELIDERVEDRRAFPRLLRLREPDE